jgi:hypothetical protein
MDTIHSGEGTINFRCVLPGHHFHVVREALNLLDTGSSSLYTFWKLRIMSLGFSKEREGVWRRRS